MSFDGKRFWGLRGRRGWRLWVCAGWLAFAGCAQPGPLAQRNALVGSLRESVASLEAKNQKLDRRVAELSAENRSLENRLVDEQAENRELARRLEDAKLATGRGSSRASAMDDAELSNRGQGTRRSQPASQPANRPAPFAQIHGEIQPLPERSTPDFEGPKRAPRRAPSRDDGELFPADDDFGLQSSRDARRTRWLEIANRPASTNRSTW